VTVSEQPMNKVMKLIFYTSAAAVAWQVLRRLFAFADLSVEQSAGRDRMAYRRATERWENEGGATLAGHTSGPPHSK
jgi:hypothetical protein